MIKKSLVLTLLAFAISSVLVSLQELECRLSSFHFHHSSSFSYLSQLITKPVINADALFAIVEEQNSDWEELEPNFRTRNFSFRFLAPGSLDKTNKYSPNDWLSEHSSVQYAYPHFMVILPKYYHFLFRFKPF